MLRYAFMQKALLGGMSVALACSLISFFVVTRRLAFMGMGISHAAFGGVGLGLAAGLDATVTAGFICVLVALGIGWLARRGRMHEDTTIGILFTASMALGALVVALARRYNMDLMSYLFGSVLAMSWGDAAAAAALSLLACLFTAAFFKELLFVAFDEETAAASGLPVRSVYYGMLTAMALVIVVSIKLVGIILVSALLVMPAATGLQLSRDYRWVLLLAVLDGLLSMALGLWVSYAADVPPGATIVMVMFGLFLLSMALSPRRWQRPTIPNGS